MTLVRATTPEDVIMQANVANTGAATMNGAGILWVNGSIAPQATPKHSRVRIATAVAMTLGLLTHGAGLIVTKVTGIIALWHPGNLNQVVHQLTRLRRAPTSAINALPTHVVYQTVVLVDPKKMMRLWYAKMLFAISLVHPHIPPYRDNGLHTTKDTKRRVYMTASPETDAYGRRQCQVVLP